MDINRSSIRSLSRPDFLDGIVFESDIKIAGITTKCYLLEFEQNDDAMDAWALHIRRHYIRDDDLEKYCSFKGVSAAEYLGSSVIPSVPQIRSGDFAEIVISDLLQFLDGYEVPRYKHNGRKDPNSSEHGTDVLAYRIKDVKSPSINDELLLVEVKSAANSSLKNALIAAGADYGKDPARIAMTMDYYLRESIDAGDMQTAEEMKRLMNKGENAYKMKLAAGAVAGVNDVAGHLAGLSSNDLGISGYDCVYILHRNQLMSLVHNLYDRCKR